VLLSETLYLYQQRAICVNKLQDGGFQLRLLKLDDEEIFTARPKLCGDDLSGYVNWLKDLVGEKLCYKVFAGIGRRQ